MRYHKEYEIDQNMRVIKCPECENEVFSTNAAHCKLCGTKLFNECTGIPEYDEYGHEINRPIHNNPGNARYCETCGEPTYFFNEGFLKPWEEEKAELEEFIEMDLGEPCKLDSKDDSSAAIDFEDIPF